MRLNLSKPATILPRSTIREAILSFRLSARIGLVAHASLLVDLHFSPLLLRDVVVFDLVEDGCDEVEDTSMRY